MASGSDPVGADAVVSLGGDGAATCVNHPARGDVDLVSSVYVCPMPSGMEIVARQPSSLPATVESSAPCNHACVVATKVLDSISTMNSHQLTLQLHGLDHQLRPYLTNRMVGQFVDRLTAVIHERASMHRTAAIT